MTIKQQDLPRIVFEIDGNDVLIVEVTEEVDYIISLFRSLAEAHDVDTHQISMRVVE